MKIHQFIVTVKHDNGTVRIKTAARNAETAKQLVMAAEHCPPSAIRRVRYIGRTIDLIITKVNGQYGAPMGRANVGVVEHVEGEKVFDCRVPMSSDGAYDRGGAYWGIGRELRVKYTRSLDFIQFYRK